MELLTVVAPRRELEALGRGAEKAEAIRLQVYCRDQSHMACSFPALEHTLCYSLVLSIFTSVPRCCWRRVPFSLGVEQR